MIYKSASCKPGYVHVVFELPACLWADRVSVVADFNGWDPCATPLRQQRDGIWRAVVDLPAGGRFEFRYLIDGRWCTDYCADGCVANCYTTLNSVVETTLPVESYALSFGSSMVHEGCDQPVPFYVKHRASL